MPTLSEDSAPFAQTAIVPIEALGRARRYRWSNRVQSLARGTAHQRRQRSSGHSGLASHQVRQSRTHSAPTARRQSGCCYGLIIEREKALSDLTVDDCAPDTATGFPYLAAQTRTTGTSRLASVSLDRPHGTRSASVRTGGPLTEPYPPPASSIRSRSSGGLFEWLVRVQYCAFNPWDGVGKITGQEQTMNRTMSN
jgi:hypothetical protein